MGRLAAVLAAGPGRTGHWCPVCVWLESLDDEERGEGNALLANLAYKPLEVVEHIAPMGYAGSNNDVHVHRQSLERRG